MVRDPGVSGDLYERPRKQQRLESFPLTLIPTEMEILTHFPSPFGRGQRVRGIAPHPYPFSLKGRRERAGRACARFPLLGADRATRDFVHSGRREWDRTTDHHHVKVVLYH